MPARSEVTGERPWRGGVLCAALGVLLLIAGLLGMHTLASSGSVHGDHPSGITMASDATHSAGTSHAADTSHAASMPDVSANPDASCTEGCGSAFALSVPQGGGTSHHSDAFAACVLALLAALILLVLPRVIVAILPTLAGIRPGRIATSTATPARPPSLIFLSISRT